eukprot:TRINITY_DN5197_c0_g1_i2.p1 TRINITY_DN5197_c0_g1~~TRINITY_DN5197_c0_g1_i2.p1  ORF type:complete len:201 (-),score=53.87 TRINITY_DN5197_c0_g1_i2:60-662(-)
MSSDTKSSLIQGETNSGQANGRRFCCYGVLALVVILIGGAALWFFLDPAPSGKTETNFEMKQLLGSWRVFASNDGFLDLTACNRIFNYKEQQDKRYTIEKCYSYPANAEHGKTTKCAIETYKKSEAVDGVNSKIRLAGFDWPNKSSFRYVLKYDAPKEAAVVIDPKEKKFWVLSKKPTIDQKTFDEYLSLVKEYLSLIHI